jgi:DHA2 family multidrug resistance protein
VPLTAIILSGLPPEKIPSAAGLSNFVRVFAGAVGTSLLSTSWNNRTILHHARLNELFNNYNPIFDDSVGQVQSTLQIGAPNALAFTENGLGGQASMLGINDVFWMSAIIFVVIIPLIWVTHPSKEAAAEAAAAGG